MRRDGAVAVADERDQQPDYVPRGAGHPPRCRSIRFKNLPLSYLDSHSSGDIVSRVIADADTFADGLLMGFSQLFTGVVTIIATLVFMLTLHVGITLLVVVLTPLSLFMARFIARRTYHLFRQQSETRGRQTALIDEMIGNQKVVKAFGYEQEAVDRFDVINEELQDCSTKAVFYSSITNPSTRFINSVIYAAVALAGAFAVLTGGLTVGGLTCLLSYANQYTKPFNDISSVITELQNSLACASRLFELIEAPSQAPDGPMEMPTAKGEVTLEHVHFRYTPQRPLIDDLHLTVKPGMKVAIVGPTGCGKTTVINLLMRFYDVNEGAVLLDGVDIRQMTRHSLRRNYGMVLAGNLAEKRHRAGKPEDGPGGRHRRRDDRGRQSDPQPRIYSPSASGIRYRFAGRQPEPGTETAFVHHPGHAVPPAGADSGRSDFQHRYPYRSADSGSVCPPDGRAHQLHCGPPAFHHPQCRLHSGDEGRPHSWNRAPTKICWPAAGFTRSSITASLRGKKPDFSRPKATGTRKFLWLFFLSYGKIKRL